MDATLRITSICLLLALAGCFSTIIPHAPLHGEHETYQVRPGDTLVEIAKRFHLGYRVLAQRNHLRPPYTIYVGQQIHLWRQAPKPSYLPMPRIHKQARRHSAAGKTKIHKAKQKAIHRVRHGVRVKLQWPLHGKVTSRFGRRHGRGHDGIDIGAREGTPVRAAAGGKVVYSDHRLSGYGNLIIVRHSHDMFTAYAHNKRNLVRKGERVKQGDIIARVGHSGRASGPHLHFEVRRGPTPVDPLAYLPRR